MARKSRTSIKAATVAKKSFLASKKAILHTMCESIMEVTKSNNNRVPYGYISTLVKENRRTFKWITRDTVNRAFVRYKQRLRGELNEVQHQLQIRLPSQQDNDDMSDLSDSQPSRKSKGGRPVGTTMENRQKKELEIMAAKNEIAEDFGKLMNDSKKKSKNVKRGALKQLINDVKRKRDINDVEIPMGTIRQRVLRKKTHSHHHAGHVSPLLAIEDTVVQLIIQMARIRECLTPSKGLSLVNSLIKGCPIQKELIEWKKKYSSNSDGKVGRGYWRAFMKRNRNKVISKRGQKYELNRQNWSTYANFVDMYKHTIIEMVEAGVARKLDEPTWMNRHGEVCDENESFGCKVTHQIIHPDMCLVGDEVGGNISMKGDGHVGGTKYLTGKGCVPQKRSSNAEKRFTLVGLTALTGDPVMCIIIIQGKEMKAHVESGIDISVNPDGDPNGPSFFIDNYGEGKYFPGGPTCIFKGKKIPAMVRWHPSGSITSEFLTDALKELDVRNVMPRSNPNVKPFILLDGHSSRLELPFLQYINTPKDNWVCCIGVPYGTALWQVGDSKEQNGSFNVAISQAKIDLVSKKETMSLPAVLEPTDMIPLINSAWKKSFARVRHNKKAIADRGWFPYNRNLLLHPDLRSTMTDQEKISEVDHPDIFLPQKKIVDCQHGNCSISSHSNSTSHSQDHSAINLNFNNGTASFCLDALVQQHDLLKSRERIKNEQSKGLSVSEMLKKAKKVTSGAVFKSGTNRLGKDILEICKENTNKKVKQLKDKMKKAEKDYLEAKAKAEALLSQDGFNIDKCKGSELKILLKPLKRTGDRAIPSKKKALRQLYDDWKNRPPMNFDYSTLDSMFVDEQTADDCDDDNEIINNETAV